MCPASADDHSIVAREEKTRKFRPTVSSLLWLLHRRPEISFAVSEVSRYVSNSGPALYVALKRILRYLKGTCDYGLLYAMSGKPQLILNASVDSDWAGKVDHRRSTSGYVMMLNDNLIIVKAKGQTSTSLSLCEAETVAMGQAVQEILSLRSILGKLG